MKHLLIIAFILGLFFIIPTHSQAQLFGKEKSDSSNFNFVPVPYINYNRTTGATFGAIPMGMFHLNRKDTLSPASMIGLGGIYSTNKSYLAMVFSKFYFADNKWRAQFATAKGNLNSQFFQETSGYQGYVDFTNNTFFVLGQLQRRIVKHLYGGINFSYTDRYTTFEDNISPPEDAKLVGIGAIVTFDTRDSVYYPRKGFFGRLMATEFPEMFGNDYVSTKVTFGLNHYTSVVRQRDVVALRAYAAMGFGDVTFGQQFVVANKDIRGYTQGEYRGDQMVAIQGEYRYNPFDKVGFVGFLGLASVFSSDNTNDNGKLLPSVGTGFRINIFPKNHMNVGMDIAAGVGDWGMYFRIGESF